MQLQTNLFLTIMNANAHVHSHKGFLLHTKTTGPEMTSQWHAKCPRQGDVNSKKDKCVVGIPSTQILGTVTSKVSGTKDKIQSMVVSSMFESNCYRHNMVTESWVPKLERALQSLMENDLLGV